MEEMQIPEDQMNDLNPDNQVEASQVTNEPKPQEEVPGGDGSQDPVGGTMPRNIGFLLEVPLQVSVELGRTRMPISELLKLNKGSVIELSQMVDAPMSVLINGKLVARGEVVVSNEKFGIRIIDIVSPDERIESLK